MFRYPPRFRKTQINDTAVYCSRVQCWTIFSLPHGKMLGSLLNTKVYLNTKAQGFISGEPEVESGEKMFWTDVSYYWLRVFSEAFPWERFIESDRMACLIFFQFLASCWAMLSSSCYISGWISDAHKHQESPWSTARNFDHGNSDLEMVPGGHGWYFSWIFHML